MRPHELLESALAACICMSIEMIAERAGTTLPEGTVEVTIDRCDNEACFNTIVRYDAVLPDADRELVRSAVLASPAANTLRKPVRMERTLTAST